MLTVEEAQEQVLAAESLDALRDSHPCGKDRHKDGAPNPAGAREFPAEDIPLRIPAEVERLRGGPERPVQA